MIRHLVAAGVVVVLLAVPLLAADPPAPPTSDRPSDNSKLDQVHKQLREISDELKANRTERQEYQKNFDVLLQRVNALERKVDELGQSRTARYYTPTEPQVGAIRLQNRSSVASTVLLSGRSYRLAPMETIVLQGQPAGVFTYEVLADGFGTIRSPLSRTLVAGETFSITVNP